MNRLRTQLQLLLPLYLLACLLLPGTASASLDLSQHAELRQQRLIGLAESVPSADFESPETIDLLPSATPPLRSVHILPLPEPDTPVAAVIALQALCFFHLSRPPPTAISC